MLDPNLTAPAVPALVTQPPEEVAAALAGIREGGFTEAAVRVALLAQKCNPGARRLSTLKQIRELVGQEVGLLALPADEAQAIIRRQSIIVEHAGAEALATLPALLKTPQDRSRLVAGLDRLSAHIGFGPALTAFGAEVRQVVSESPAADGSVLSFPSYAAG